MRSTRLARFCGRGSSDRRVRGQAVQPRLLSRKCAGLGLALELRVSLLVVFLSLTLLLALFADPVQ